MLENEGEEILDIVDSNDQVIGTVRRKDYGSLPVNQFIRFSEIFIQRPDGDIWLPRRSKTKKIAPGGLDMSAAGHVLSDETYEEAAIREIAEETGIAIESSRLQEISSLPQVLYDVFESYSWSLPANTQLWSATNTQRANGFHLINYYQK